MSRSLGGGVMEPAPALVSSADVTLDVLCLRTGIANAFLFGQPGAGDGEWVLVDAGMSGAAGPIRQAVAERFRPGARPACIVLTHGHFDHVGALRELADEWDVPVYAHELELPYVTGRSAYPPPDPSVGGGAMARLAFAYPKAPVDAGRHVRTLPADGSVPGMRGWRWIHTPGHTHGHVSLFRDDDRTLIAGDAVITTRQESLIAVATQRPELNGPPMYFTSDWRAAGESVRRLAALEPRIVATGHGVPLAGDSVSRELHHLAGNFDRLAVPRRGRYVGHPAIADRSGVVHVPPRPPLAPTTRLVLAGIGVLAAAAALSTTQRRR
jgi:glyoxylase-like metal-dependent hydrolase (beta-lactamase superfamily II)